jgi:hypothetical protein
MVIVGAWLRADYGMLVLSVYLALGGLFTALRPATMIRWTLRNNPELATHRDTVLTTRLIGLMILFIALLMIACQALIPPDRIFRGANFGDSALSSWADVESVLVLSRG